MKNKTKKILAGVGLGLVGMGCLTGCNAEDLKIPTDYNVTINQEKQYRLTVINDSENGIISPDLKGETCSVMVDEGDNYTFTIRPKEGYKLDNLLIDGELVAPQEIYTFDDVDSDHSIGAVYSKLEGVYAIKSLRPIGVRFELPAGVDGESLNGAFGIYQNKRPEQFIAGEDLLIDDVTKLFSSDSYWNLIDMVSVPDGAGGTKDLAEIQTWETVNTPYAYFDNDEINLLIGYSSLNIVGAKFTRQDLKYIGNTFNPVYEVELDIDWKLECVAASGGVRTIHGIKVYFIANY